MKKKRLIDSYAMMAYLKKENGYKKVVELLSVPKDGFLIMNEINVGESYYIIARERGAKEADYFVGTILPTLPIRLISNSFDDIIEASKIKASHPMSYADCFAVATAMREKASIVTGDPEFKRVKNLVEVEWL
ncbi:MAG: type II toxin-antitoxin system VapC family toxin [Deltaproteobacteria bacterium]|nr:type II toxin-antitoxin system VapC family toxin [Deltaproteobacteria bacterium]